MSLSNSQIMNAIQGLNANWFSDESTNYCETYRNEADELFHSPNEEGQIKCYTEPEDIPTNELEPCNYTDLRVLQDGILQLIAQNEKLKALAALGAEQVLSHHGLCPKDEEIKKLKEENEELKDLCGKQGEVYALVLSREGQVKKELGELKEQVENLSQLVEEHTDDDGDLIDPDEHADATHKLDCITKYVAGDYSMQDEVEEHLEEIYSKEFIKGNTETWQQFGLFEDEI